MTPIPEPDFKTRFAQRLQKWLGVFDADAEVIRAPGATAALRCEEIDGRHVVVICNGETFDILHGHPRGTRGMTVFNLSSRNAVALSRFLFWNYYVKGTWFGLKTALWNWAMTHIVDYEQRKTFAKWRKISPDPVKPVYPN